LRVTGFEFGGEDRFEVHLRLLRKLIGRATVLNVSI
jgi:hypothetical protein